jgi:hypothetical protein
MCKLLLTYDEYIFFGFFIGFLVRSLINGFAFDAINYNLRHGPGRTGNLLLHFTFWWKKETREEFPAAARIMNICNIIHISYLALLLLFLVSWYSCIMCCR